MISTNTPTPPPTIIASTPTPVIQLLQATLKPQPCRPESWRLLIAAAICQSLRLLHLGGNLALQLRLLLGLLLLLELDLVGALKSCFDDLLLFRAEACGDGGV